MFPDLIKIKGIHPGAILKWELEKKNIKSSDLAKQLGEHKQTLSSIMKGKRNITPSLSIKLSKIFHTEEDYFMLLQASYNVKSISKNHLNKAPNIKKFRRAIFWDTSLDKIDWIKNKRAIIKRVLERGNNTEINEIISFYGRESISDEIKSIKKSRIASFEKNILEFNLI